MKPRTLVVLASGLLCSSFANAVTVWTDWTAATVGAPGSASGSVSGVGVTYSGEVLSGSVTNGTSTIWNPSATYVGGTSTTSPNTVGDEIRLNGTYTGTNTITFASPVVDPLFAIWSLGAGGPASFTFSATPTLQVGGPNSIYGGSTITVSGNTVTGREGNGVVQFTGTFSSISWTDTFEHYYAFTVGINGVADGGGGSTVPEPGSLALLGFGLMGLAIARRRKTR